MLSSVFAKTIRDRWKGWGIAVITLSLLLLMAMSAYREIDLRAYTELPEAYLSIVGLSETADVGSLAIRVLFGTYDAITIAAMALAMGASLIAGEENQGTIGLLLSNPKSRTHILVSKAASLVVLTSLSVLVLWAVVYPTTAIL